MSRTGYATLGRTIGAAINRYQRNKRYSAVIGYSEEIYDSSEIIDEDRLIDLEYLPEIKNLSFKVQHYHAEPKIVRYVQRNYERTPVYDGSLSERTKILKSFNRIINPVKFANEDILKLNLAKEFIIAILGEINVMPAWYEKELAIEKLEKEIDEQYSLLRHFPSEKKIFTPKETDYPEEPSNFWIRLLFGPFTLGLSFLGFLSKKNAALNTKINQENEEWNEKERKEVNKANKALGLEIDAYNQIILTAVKKLNEKKEKVEAKELMVENQYEDGWLDLTDASNMHYPKLVNRKGVYVIWNKTKNKYYVGQSKNMQSRLMNHFKDGEPKNIAFARDFYEKDLFVYKYYFCETKDQLDAWEKRYIEQYAAFENGYNKTGGNK